MRMTENVVKKKLFKIFDKGEIDYRNFLDVLISNRITWHGGGMSDPFQPAEKKFNVTGMTCSSCSAHVEKSIKNLKDNVKIRLIQKYLIHIKDTWNVDSMMKLQY